MCFQSLKATGQWWIHCCAIKSAERCAEGEAEVVVAVHVGGHGARRRWDAASSSLSGVQQPLRQAVHLHSSVRELEAATEQFMLQPALALNYAWPIYHAPSWKTNCVPGIYLLEIVVCCAGVPRVSSRANDWEVRACSEQDSWLHQSHRAVDRFFTSIAFLRVSPLLPIFLTLHYTQSGCRSPSSSL